MSVNKKVLCLRVQGFYVLSCILLLAFSLQVLFLKFSWALGSGTTGSQFLKLGVGSRPAGMGEAFVAVADDLNALYWNPAGLGNVEGRQASLIHTEWFQCIRYEYIGYCQPLAGGVIGAGATFLWIDGIERRTTDTPEPEGYVPARDLSVSVAYGKGLSERLNAGLSLKGIYRQLDNSTAGGAAIDIGLLYKPSPGAFTLGLAIQNIGAQGAFINEPDPLPLNLKAGIANKSIDGNFTFAADLNYGLVDNVWSAGAGIEWWIDPAFSIRSGYRFNSSSTSSLGFLSGLSCGAGFKLNILNIDYAFVPYGDLGYTHRVSLLAKF